MSYRKGVRALLAAVFLLAWVSSASRPNVFQSASADRAYCVSDPSDVQDCIHQEGWYWDYEDCSCHKIALSNKEDGPTNRWVDADAGSTG